MRWLAPPLVTAGLLWAFIQFAFTAFPAPVARRDRLTQCGQDLGYGLLTGLTEAVVIVAARPCRRRDYEVWQVGSAAAPDVTATLVNPRG
jgi:hypothetical protein